MQKYATRFLLIVSVTACTSASLMAMQTPAQIKRELVAKYAKAKTRADSIQGSDSGESNRNDQLSTPLLRKDSKQEEQRHFGQLHGIKPGDVIVHTEQQERNRTIEALLYALLASCTSLSNDPQSIIIDYVRPAWSGSTIVTMEGMVVHSEYVGNDQIYLTRLKDARLHNHLFDMKRRAVIDQKISDIKLRTPIDQCEWLEKSAVPIFRTKKRGLTLDYDQTSDGKKRIAVDDRVGVIVWGNHDQTLDEAMLWGAARSIAKKKTPHQQPEDVIVSARFTADGASIAASSLDGTITTFDATTLNPLATLYNHDSVTSLTCTPEGAILAWLADGSLVRWAQESDDVAVQSDPSSIAAKKKISAELNVNKAPARASMQDSHESAFTVKEAKASAREICGTNCLMCCGIWCCAPCQVCAIAVTCGSCGFVVCRKDRSICPSQEAKASASALCCNNIDNCCFAACMIPMCILQGCRLGVSCCCNAPQCCTESC